jgi:hypothetical protein
MSAHPDASGDGHILDDSWMTDELAKQRGLDIDQGEREQVRRGSAV